ncbi:MAG: hypothetical protein AAB959_00040 [Patescibacteria group bacterium]
MSTTLTLNFPVSVFIKPNLNLKFFRALSLISIISLLIFYIFQVTSLAKDQYLLKENQMKLTDLVKQRGALEINFYKIQSLTNLDAYFLSQNFEKSKQTKYIQIYSPLVKVDEN